MHEMSHFLVGYAVNEPIEGKWFIMEYVVVRASTKNDAKRRFESYTDEARRKDRWKNVELSVQRIRVYQ